MEIFKLFGSIFVDNKQANKSIAKTEGKAQGLAKRLGDGIKTAAKWGAGIAAGAATAGVALAGVAAKGVKEFQEFESDMKEVFTLLPDITEKEMSKMEEQIKDLSKEMGVLPEESVPALYQAISAGVPKGNVFEFLEQAQKAAVGGVTELETAVDGISSVVNAYGSDILSAAQTSDLMFTAVKNGKTTFDEMASTLYNVIPTASALGVEFGDITAAIATMTASGTPTAQATTQIRQALNELSKSGSAAADLFQELSGKTFQEFVNEGGNLQEALALMNTHAEETGVGVKDLFSSVEAGAAAMSLTGKNADKFSKNIQDMANSAGATEKAYQTMDSSLKRSFDKIGAAIKVLWIDLGQKLEPVAKGFADWLQSNMPAIQGVVTKVFDIVSAGVNFICETIIPMFRVAFESFKEFFVKNSEDISGIWEQVKEVFRTVTELITEIISLAVEAIMLIWDKWGEDITKSVKAIFENIKILIDGSLKIAKELLQGFICLVKGDWSGLGEHLLNVLEIAFVSIGKMLNNLWENVFKKPFMAVKDGVAWVFDSIVDGVKNSINWVIGKINGLIDGVNEIADKIPGISGGIPNIPMLAEGGDIVSSGAVIVGEKGPELLNLPKGARVTPLDHPSVDSRSESPKIINLTANYHVTDQRTAEYANNDLVRRLQGRGLAGAYR